MNLVLTQVLENRRTVKTTLLRRPNGTWSQNEVGLLVDGLRNEVSRHTQHPEYLIINGHYTKEQTLEALLGGVAYTATQMTGIQGLPFTPGFV